ncbi:MAG TPA: glycoside hydrolase family 15 protein [Gaiellaceae bacterium]|nr:glycoside hydrolase family 15 protein [Gaiellaceae bacterium]
MATKAGREHTTRAPARVDGYARIGDYAAIGDGRTVALVALDGSIDWLPLPTIDQSAAFGAVLDAERAGRFRLAPEGDAAVRRRYLERTNVLETTYTCDSGELRVVDALTLQDGGLVPWVELARSFECVSGTVRLSWTVEPRFGLAQEDVEVFERDGTPVASGRRLNLAVLAWDAGTPLCTSDSVAGSIELGEGDTGLVACVATDHEPLPRPEREEIETRLAGTAAAWRRWVEGRDYDGPWPDAVERSALALKLLTYAPSGAVAAAATTALPERIGGDRNYDYRFCWIRDTCFALDALVELGLREQVHASLSWLLEASAKTHPRLQPFYALDGSVPRTTETLPLNGYRGSQPVRRGNGASTQLQLGNFGDLFDTVWNYVEQGNLIDRGTGRRLAESASFVCRVWRNDDAGLWELGENRPYTSSKLSCWLALRRAVQLAERGLVPRDDLDRWRGESEQIAAFVDARCWSEEKQSYTFYAGSDDLDCAVLLGQHSGFGDPAGERWRSTIAALQRELTAEGPLIYRYSGMREQEGCFLACSFWLAAALAKAGRVDEARRTMEDLLALANDVGLYSEEIDPATHELLGNFPQALTHLSLIRAATTVNDAERDDGGSR